MNKIGWALPFMGLGGGIAGLVGMTLGGSALRKSAAGYSFPDLGYTDTVHGLSGGTILGGTKSPFNYGKNIIGAGALGVGSTVAQTLGFEGMAFNMRKIMRSHVEDFKDASFISMINNPGIPIEDLIFMFMAYMADKYEKKLREKMEETALAEKKERRRQRIMDEAKMLGGIASAVPLGIGRVIGAGIEMVAAEGIRIHDALDGNMKSSTLLMQEVQMLMHKWQRLNELLSNLLKVLHDMAMVPIRNVR